MSLRDKIRNIYPSLSDSDFIYAIVLQDNSDGKGPFIAQWNHPTLARPTDEQLAAAPDTPHEPVKSLTPKEKLERAGLSLDEFAQLIEEAQSIIKHDPPPDKERGV